MTKGLAILIMTSFHFCLYSSMMPTVDGDNLIVKFIGSVGKICVAIYAVLSGYGYSFAKEKSIKYGLKKSYGLLEIYWISLFTLYLPIALHGGWKITPVNFIVQLFALLPNINWFAWYVFFFIFCMMVMPLVHKIFKFNPIINFAIAVIIPFALEIVIHFIPNNENITILHDLFSCFLYFPSFLVGYLIAKHKIFEAINSKLNHNIFISIIGIIVVLIARYYVNSVFGFLLDTFYAPIIVFCVSNLSYHISKKDIKFISVPFSLLGKYSTGIWFIHAIFFSTYLTDVFIPILLLIKVPVLMYLVMLLISMIIAVIYQVLLDFIKKELSKIKKVN